ncbi:catalase-related domain-containing protein [Abyssogena phaseoliformis symbiont]|uniref:catalase-related domain-containing protein n=1 Tax=Abyssogena phaseoliformis symbiont TaxID=596095 RepID=UPI001915A953|nr:catalase-related domain-containing protein [Abyssogena phaseoliformis symbiont]
MLIEENAWIERFDTIDAQDYYQQAGDLFKLMNELQKTQLTTTIAEGLAQASQHSNKCLCNLKKQMLIMQI